MTNKNLPPTTYNLKPNRGFAMLFSVLISSLLVVIGLSIFNLTLKELTISTAARESQAAFYAAHAGLECALYWDNPNGIGGRITAFDTPADITGTPAAISGSIVSCGGSLVAKTVTPSPPISPTSIKTEFTFNITSSANPPCVNVIVTKSQKSPSGIDTVIESRGKNICGAGRKVERGLRADYEL